MVRGKEVFADKCASCHSSKTPKNMPGDEAGQKKAWRELVLHGDDRGPFLDKNYLSDDKRYPVSELHTNAARALATNALHGHLWDNFSSETYKNQADARGQLQDEDEQGKPRDLYNPLTGQYTLKFTVPSDRVASYRTPSLVSIWATAPYLHNNSVGTFNGDPSVAGRMAAFEDGMSKLLWPQRRLGVRSIKVTSEDCRLPDLFDVLESEFQRAKLPPLLPVPEMRLDLLRVSQGTPINLIANLHPKDIRAVLEAYLEGCLDGQPRERVSFLLRVNHELGHQRMLQKLLELNPCPDFIEDKGHTYGRDLTDDDKRALIQFIKTF
jgi:hypothetical protein